VLTPTSHILLIDFGSAAPLLPPEPDGSRRVPKDKCLVPCGTCDYISPEVLQAHEAALVALEMSDDSGIQVSLKDDETYGLEVDWWSLGAMLFELAYGIAPFFASDIRRTYLKIMDYKVTCASIFVIFNLNFCIRKASVSPKM
jgi:serine/threonine protein kinase